MMLECVQIENGVCMAYSVRDLSVALSSEAGLLLEVAFLLVAVAIGLGLGRMAGGG
jgi:hypothetical protein